MKIGLGTAQFGLDYGVTNTQGRVNEQTIRDLLAMAYINKINLIDTAALYGSSEDALGKCLPRGTSFNIVTKTPHFPETLTAEALTSLLEESFMRSLNLLKQQTVYGLLVHNADNLLQKNGLALWECMQELKQHGLVEKIGVSVYTAHQIDAVLDQFAIDLIQLPINIFDQRLLASGHLARLKKMNIEIHARSVFLQGLLLANDAQVSPVLQRIDKHFSTYKQWIAHQGLSPLQAALAFVLAQKEIDATVVGVCSVAQLHDIIVALQLQAGAIDFQPCALYDEYVLNPSQWK